MQFMLVKRKVYANDIDIYNQNFIFQNLSHKTQHIEYDEISIRTSTENKLALVPVLAYLIN